MNVSNIYRFNGKDPFDNWVIIDSCLYGYYPRNSIINILSTSCGVIIKHHSIYIPEGVISIKNSCFKKLKRYKKVFIPFSVKSISIEAFKDTDVILMVCPSSYAEKYASKRGLRYQVI